MIEGFKNDKKIQIIGHVVLALLAISAVLPFILLFMASITSESAAIRDGFSFFPKEFSIEAYKYLLGEWNQIGRAYLNSIIVTIVGTILGLIICTLLSYGLTKDIVGKKIITFYVIFTMLFNGGIVSSYFVYTNVFHIKDTFWALIIPNLLLNVFNIMIQRSYFKANIPEALLESARIDGSNEYSTFFRIVLPLSKPILATLGLMNAIFYWNDWINGLYYIENPKLFTLQLVLNNINENAAFLARNSTQMSSMVHGTASIPTTTVRMAIAIIGILPMMIAYPFFQKHFVKGITIGAIKG